MKEMFWGSQEKKRKTHKRMTQNSKKNNDNTIFSLKHHLKTTVTLTPNPQNPLMAKREKEQGIPKEAQH